MELHRRNAQRQHGLRQVHRQKLHGGEHQLQQLNPERDGQRLLCRGQCLLHLRRQDLRTNGAENLQRILYCHFRMLRRLWQRRGL